MMANRFRRQEAKIGNFGRVEQLFHDVAQVSLHSGGRQETRNPGHAGTMEYLAREGSLVAQVQVEISLRASISIAMPRAACHLPKFPSIARYRTGNFVSNDLLRRHDNQTGIKEWLTSIFAAVGATQQSEAGIEKSPAQQRFFKKFWHRHAR